MPFLRDVLAGRKRLLKLDSVRHVEVPRFKEFSTKSLLGPALNDAELLPFLPNCRLEDPINKQWFFDVIATIKPGWWEEQIAAAMQRRLERGTQENNSQVIEMQPEFLALISQSRHVPHSQRGKVVSHLVTKQKPASGMM